MPVLDDVQLEMEPERLAQLTVDELDFFRSVTQQSFANMTELLDQNLATLSQQVSTYLLMMQSFIHKVNEKSIAQVGMNAFKQFVTKIGRKATEDMWTHIVAAVDHLFDKTTPRILLEQKEAANSG